MDTVRQINKTCLNTQTGQSKFTWSKIAPNASQWLMRYNTFGHQLPNVTSIIAPIKFHTGSHKLIKPQYYQENRCKDLHFSSCHSLGSSCKAFVRFGNFDKDPNQRGQHIMNGAVLFYYQNINQFCAGVRLHTKNTTSDFNSLTSMCYRLFSTYKPCRSIYSIAQTLHGEMFTL